MKKLYEVPQLLALTFEAEECLSVSATPDDNVIVGIDEILGD